MPVNPENLEIVIDNAMQQIAGLLEQAGYSEQSPIMDLLREARAYAGEVRTLQARYIELAQEYLVDKQIFAWSRDDQSAAFEKDILQYEELVAYCLVAGDISLLDWGVHHHKRFVPSHAFQAYASRLAQKRDDGIRDLSSNPDAAEELKSCYNHLIQLLSAG